jgi:hypothetical protein
MDVCRDLCRKARAEAPIKLQRPEDQNANKGVDCRYIGAVAGLFGKGAPRKYA